MALRFLNNLAINGTGTVLDVQGTQGQLFSVTDSLTGDLFSVSDISGVPILNVNSSGAITIDGTLTSNGQITGTELEGTSLDINGDADVSGTLLLAEFIKHTGDVNTNIQFLAGQMILKNSGGKYINLHANGIIYFDASSYTFNTGNVTLPGIVLDGNTITGVDDSNEFTDNDSHIMTSAAVQDKILGYGYGTGTSNLAIGTTSSTAMAGNTTIPSACTHPTNLAGDDINVDTGALTGAVVISDLDFNITTNTAGHVTDANGTVATRTLTLANLGYTGATNATADQTNVSGSAGTVSSIGNLTGDVTSSNRTTTIASAAVHHAMLHDDIISGQGELTSGLADTDEFMISDAGTVKRMDSSVLKTYMQNGLTFTTNTNTQLSTEAVQDIVGGMLVGTETRIGVSYDDTNGRINFVVDDMTANTNTQLSNAQVRAATAAATDSQVFTDADHTKLNGIEASATADQTVTNSTSTTSSTTVASATAVKAAYDRGSTGVTNAASAQTTANAALPKAGGTMSGAIEMGDNNINNVNGITADQLNLKDAGDYITFYGGDQQEHSISSRDSGGTISDDLRINSYGALYINLDSNNNNTSGADFVVARHGGAASTISNLFIVNGENGNGIFGGSVTANGTTLTGTQTTVSGSSGSCTGLAATATALATTRAIGGVNFNGTAAINLPGVNTAGNQNTSGNATTATTATNANNIKTTSVSNSTDYFGVFVDANGTAYQDLHVGAGLKYNPEADTLTAGKISTEVASIVENNKSNSALMTLTGQGAGNEANISLKLVGTADGQPIKMKMVALDDGGDQVGAGVISYDAEDDSLGIGQSSSHNRMAIRMENTISLSSPDVHYEPTSIKAREYVASANGTHYDFYGDIMRNGNDTTVRGKLYIFKTGTWTIANADTLLEANGLAGIALGTNSSTHGMLLKGTYTLDYDPGGAGNVLYVSLTNGLLATAIPGNSGDVVRVMGYLIGGTHGTIFFDPAKTFVEVA